MERIFYKWLSLSALLVLCFFAVGDIIKENNIYGDSVFYGDNANKINKLDFGLNGITGFVVHPLYSGFSSAESGFRFNASNNSLFVSDTIVYKIGYYSVNGSAWQIFVLNGSLYNSNSNWLAGSGVKSLPEFGFGEHYLIVYSCSYSSSVWDCHDGKWQLIVFNNTNSSSVASNVNCSDGLLNGNETGIDCGGSCAACVAVPAVTVFASSYETGNGPEKIYDGNISTRWSALGLGEWIQFNFSSPQTFNQVSVAVYTGNTRLSYFNISVSNDGVSWTTVYSGNNSGTTANFENYSFSTVTVPYLRIVGRGSNLSAWNSYAEVSWALVSGGSSCSGSSSQSCSITNGVGIQSKTCVDGNWSGWGACTVASCNSGYSVCGNGCNLSYRSCSITNGVGNQTGYCSSGSWYWNACSVVSCNSGYHVSGSSCVVDSSPVCGDGSCNGVETCSSCSADCGACPSTNYLRTFYVSNTGSDSNDGTSESSPWKTIAKVNSKTFLPGDGILFKSGDMWREALVIPSSGNASNYITFGAYGSGSKPKLYGSNTSSSWTETATGSNIWKSSTSFSKDPFNGAMFTSEIFFVETNGSINWGVHKTSTSLTAEYQWTYSSGYIYVYAASNPASRYSSVEIPQRDYVINVGDTNQYIAIDSLDIRYAMSINVDDRDPPSSLTGFTIKNCHIAYVGSRDNAAGYNLAVLRNNLLIQNNDIHDGGRRIVSIHAYDVNGATFSNITLEGNYLHEGYHGSGFGINMDGSSNYGNTFQNIIVRNNIFYDNVNRDPANDGLDPTQQGTFRVEQSGGTIKNILVYNNIFMYPNGDGLWIENVDNVSVYNNVFYDFNHHSTLSYGGEQFGISNGCTDVNVKNNIFYGLGNYATVKYNHVFIQSSQTDTSEISLDYNLFYQTDSLIKMFNVHDGNYIYGSGCLYCNSWASLYADYGWQQHDPGIVNPLFVDAAGGDYHLQSGSPAIGAGINVGLVSDYDSVAYNNPPSIGAFEYD